ncbi:MAG: hydroxyethylthiazole kinase [Rhodobacterales bacterium]|nr:MAG: hydroxyethylthiazole kinase [Rhodobacterales bacterium]
MTNQNPQDALHAMRMANPLVQCITNFVAMNISANTLLAAGASPAMVHTQQESGDFAAIAGALTVNIGTLSPDWVEGMKAAIVAAKQAGKPWVLDPVANFATPYRQAVAGELLAMGPTVLRGNASEIMALAGQQSAGQGVDAGDSVAAAEQAARALAGKFQTVVVITGEVDFVTDGTRAARVSGGSDIMPKITAMGCALTCLIGAFLAVEPDAFAASIAALTLFAEAGARTGATATGPGAFAWQFLDQLAGLELADIDLSRVVEQ